MKDNKEKQECPVCEGEGRIVVSKPTGVGKHFAEINERCPICKGEGEL